MGFSNKVTTFTFFLLVTPLFYSNQTLAKHRNPKNTLVLGLVHSTTSLPLPNVSINSRKRTAETLDMMEPLREVRDGYLISLNIGSPPQVIQVYMDTGSDLTWVPCGNVSFDCMGCDEYRYSNFMSAFSPSYSSSSYRESCSSSYCTNIHSSDNPFDPCIIAGCSLSTLIRAACLRPCPSFAYTYGAGGVVTGTLTRDTLRVHEKALGDDTKDIRNFTFGCVRSTYHEPIGIAGFGRGKISFLSQLGLLKIGFSHCFLAFKYANNPNISSPLVIGNGALISKENMQFTPMLRSPKYPNYYYIGLEGVTIGNVSATQVPLRLKGFDSEGNGGMLIDSGTTYTHLPEPFYSNLLSTLKSVINYPRATEVEMRSGFDLCYKVPCPNNILLEDDHVFPSITFHFLNNVSFVLPQGNQFYAMSAPTNFTVVKCLLFQSMDDGDYGPAGVFGSFQQQNIEIVYDLAEEKIGFQPMDCASAATSQGLKKM